MEPYKSDAPPKSLVTDLLQDTPQSPLATMIQGLQYQAPPRMYDGKECLYLRGLPEDIQPDTIIEFLAQHAEAVIKGGLHILYNSEGEPLGEAVIQMDCEEAALWAVRHSNNRFMVVGQKASRVEAFLCSVDEMENMLAWPPGPFTPSDEESLPEPRDGINPDQPPVPTSENAATATWPEGVSSSLAAFEMPTSETVATATWLEGVSSSLAAFEMPTSETVAAATSPEVEWLPEGVSSTGAPSNMATSETAAAAAWPPRVSSTSTLSDMPTWEPVAAGTWPPRVLSTLTPSDMPASEPSAAATPPPGLSSTLVPSGMPWSPSSPVTSPGGGKTDLVNFTILCVNSLPDSATKQDIMASFNCYPDLKTDSVYMLGDADRNLEGSAFVVVSCPEKTVRTLLGRQSLYMCNRKVDLCIIDTDCALRWLTAPCRAHLFNIPPQPSLPFN